MIPACAPSTPASHEPSVLTTSPFSYSFVSSPRYHRLPRESCAYQSSVSSTGSPSSVTRSWTSVAGMPRMSCLARHGDLDLLLGAIGVGLAVDPAASRRHRPERVAERHPDEHVWIEHDRVGALGQCDRRWRGTGGGGLVGGVVAGVVGPSKLLARSGSLCCRHRAWRSSPRTQARDPVRSSEHEPPPLR